MNNSLYSDFKKFQAVIYDNGYTLSRVNGDHYIYIKHGRKPISLVRRNLNPMVARRIVKENNLEVR